MPDLLSDKDLEALQGEIISRSFKAGYIVLSYFVSYIGAFTTLEIIMRKTASRGWYNWFLHAAASISMGGISIWCMHFVGNCAIVLGDGQPQLQIDISPGFTALSLSMPIVVLFIAFGVVGSDESSITRVVLGAVLAGLGICGMHYLGQAGISNYDCTYNVATTVGATAIAVVASVTALVIFFIFRSAWNTAWWKRGLCAAILASAVSGMHWLASYGTAYRYKTARSRSTNAMSITTTVVVVIVLSIVCCLTLVFLTLLEQARMRRSAKRAEQVVLAAAVFDSHGKLLVTHEGLLPARKIANSWLERSFDDIFNVAHPVFLWIFRTSHNWHAISTLLPEMKRNIWRSGIRGRLGSLDETALFNDEGTPINDYSIIFRELFCIAAAELADDLHQPIEKLGVLYDEIITTGVAAKAVEQGKKSIATAASSLLDVEREGGSSLGKGQLLFLVSRANRFEAEALLGSGFSFAHAENVVPIIANSLRMGPRGLKRRLEIMRHYATDHHVLEPGVHVACFAIRASLAVGKRGFDILVRRDAKNQLPTMKSPIETLEPWHVEYLETLDSRSISVCVKQLYKASKLSNKSPRERDFAKHFLKTIEILKEEVEDPMFNDALLIAKPFEAPCRGRDEHSPPGLAQLIAFRMILPLHGRAPGRKLTFTPLNLFKTQQRVYKNSPDHGVFARSIHREFAPLLDLTRSETYDDNIAEHSLLAPGPARGSTTTRSSRNEVGMGEYIDMYGNALPEATTEYRGPSKIRFWDRPARSISRSRSNRSSGQNLMADSGAQHSKAEHEEIPNDERRTSSRPCSVSSPERAGSPTNKSGQGVEMQSLNQGNQEQRSSGGKPGPTRDEEMKLYIEGLFALTIEKRQM